MALIVFFRGINVGGHRASRPSVLAKELGGYDAVNVGAAEIWSALETRSGKTDIAVSATLLSAGDYMLSAFARHSELDSWTFRLAK